MTFAAFGCSLDVLDAPEKMAMKLAYMNALREGLISGIVARDPYDLVLRELDGEQGVVAVGRLEIEPWLTPRPGIDALESVDVLLYREFLDTGGCEVISARVREFVRDRVLPLGPFMIGVDHSLTYGVLEALRQAGQRDLGLIVLDSHFDAIPASVRRAAVGEDDEGEQGDDKDRVPDSFSCGSWLAQVLSEGLVLPQNVAVIGPSDYPGTEAMEGELEAMGEYRRAYLGFEEQGVTVIPKHRVREIGVEKAASVAIRATGSDSYYVSIDADIGAGDSVKAVRFFDTIGLDPDDVVTLCGSIAEEIRSSGSRLAGLDVMEIDVHLADIPGSGDRTVEMCAAAAREIIRRAGG